MIQFHVLGSTVIQKKKQALDHSFLAGSKRLALFSYLVLAKPRDYHRRDILISIFWPDLGQKSARNALSNIIYHIRDALGKDILQNRGSEEIVVNFDKIWCDALAFEEELEKKNYKRALDLYRGDILQGLYISNISSEFQDWLDNEREQLRRQAADACLKLADELLEGGNPAYAREYALEASELMPLSHKHQTAAIDFLINAGFPNDVIAAYSRYKEKLSKDLDIAPPEELTMRVQSLKEQSSPTEKNGMDETTEAATQIHRVSGDKKEVEEGANSQSSPQLTNKYGLQITAVAVLVLALAGWFLMDRADPPASTLTAPNSIAVLPFTYINAPDSTDYFSLGMTEEILTKLARAGGLSVTSRTSIMQYQNSNKTLKEIAHELGVAAVVEGSINRSGNQIRISAKLIDADTDRNLWANSYDRSLENILAVQNEVASHIANALQTELSPQETTAGRQLPEVNEEAYHKYLLGKHLLDINEPGSVVQAVDHFEQAIAIDSTFALAYSNLAMARLLSGLVSRFSEEVTGVHGMPLTDAAELSSKAAQRALDLDSSMLEAQLSLAIINELVYQDWEESDQLYQRALQLNPNHSETLRFYGWHLLRVGELEKARNLFEKAVMVDPLSWVTHHSLGYAYYCSHNYDDAIQQLETSISLGSLYPNTKKYLSTAWFKKSHQLFKEGKEEEARTMIEQASTLLVEMWGPETGWKDTIISAAAGDKETTLSNLDEKSLPLPLKIYATLMIDERESALELIENRLNFHHRVFIDPIFDAVRSDQRFHELVRDKLNRNVAFP